MKIQMLLEMLLNKIACSNEVSMFAYCLIAGMSCWYI